LVGARWGGIGGEYKKGKGGGRGESPKSGKTKKGPGCGVWFKEDCKQKRKAYMKGNGWRGGQKGMARLRQQIVKR